MGGVHFALVSVKLWTGMGSSIPLSFLGIAACSPLLGGVTGRAETAEAALCCPEPRVLPPSAWGAGQPGFQAWASFGHEGCSNSQFGNSNSGKQKLCCKISSFLGRTPSSYS